MLRPTSVNQRRTILLAIDDKSSVNHELEGASPNPRAYTVYGWQSAQQLVASHLGFNGELCERNIGWYLLGKGYRAYNPILMRFHSPDSWSPFGEGELNAYAYCEGDPKNFTDPTGHMLSGLKRFGKWRKTLVGASSTSSLSPLTTNAADMASTAPSKATSKTIPALTREKVDLLQTKFETQIGSRTHIETWTSTSRHPGRDFKDYGPWPKTPPRIPLKQRLVPRVNDTGGHVSMADGEVWRSTPYQFPSGPAPLPPTRTRPNGVSLHYSMRFDSTGHSTLTSLEKISLAQRQNQIRNVSGGK